MIGATNWLQNLENFKLSYFFSKFKVILDPHTLLDRFETKDEVLIDDIYSRKPQKSQIFSSWKRPSMPKLCRKLNSFKNFFVLHAHLVFELWSWEEIANRAGFWRFLHCQVLDVVGRVFEDILIASINWSATDGQSTCLLAWRWWSWTFVRSCLLLSGCACKQSCVTVIELASPVLWRLKMVKKLGIWRFKEDSLIQERLNRIPET